MDKQICSLVEQSRWLELDAINFMKIKRSTPIYSMIEMISLNVAASHRTTWIIIHRSNLYQTSLYSARIVTALLIRSVLLSTYQMKEYEVNDFFDDEIVLAIQYYFDYTKLKK
jgi:hypothetical protein